MLDNIALDFAGLGEIEGLSYLVSRLWRDALATGERFLENLEEGGSVEGSRAFV